MHLDQLIIAYLSGDISKSNLEELEKQLNRSRDARERFARISSHDVALRRALQMREFKEQPLYVSRKHRFTIRRLTRCVSAAAVLLAGCAVVFLVVNRQEPSPVQQLAQRARTVATVSDIRTIASLCDRAYKTELNKGDACDLHTLISLGFARAVAGTPRRDRQAQDLKFALSRIRKRRRIALHRLRVFPAAEAAAGIDTAVHTCIRELYDNAQTAHLRHRYYDKWDYLLEKLVRYCRKARKPELVNALRFERAYFTAYERELSRRALSVFHSLAEESVYRQYYRIELSEMVTAAVQQETRREMNIDFDLFRTFGSGKWEIEKREGMGFVIRHLDRGAGPGYFLSKVSLPLPCVFSCQMRADYPAVEKKGAGFGMGMARVHEKLDAWPPDRRKMRWTGSCLGIEKGAKSCGFAKWDRWQMRLRKENDNVVAEVRCAAEGKSPGPWKSLKEDYGVDVPDVDTHTALGAVGFYAKDLTCEFRDLELYSSSRDE